MASDTSPHQNQINALPAPPLQSLEPNYWNWNWNWNWNLPQLKQNTVETSTETKSLIADESQVLGLNDDSYDESSGESYDDSYGDSDDAPAPSVLESALVLAVALQHALDQLLAPHKMQDVPLEENPKFYGGENLQQDSLLSFLSFIGFLLTAFPII